MAKNRISEDRISLIIDAESEKAQQAIHELEKATKQLREENKARLNQMLDLEKAGQKESAYYKNLQAEYKKTTKQINENTKAISEHTKRISVNHMTMNQLRKEAGQLQKQMDSVSKSLNPDLYKQLEDRLKSVKDRMTDLRSSSTGLKEIFLSKTNLGFLMGSGLVGVVSKGLDMVIGLANAAISKTRELVNEGIEMAKSADGITHAFEQMNRPDILDQLREATHGTVNDVELMKAAVQAKDFRLPLEQLGKYLEYAQLKAQQTGQSVDYMTNSIVTGLGRKSPQILDNLGISAAQIKEEMAKGGDMATAVGRIIEQQLSAQGDHYETAAEREQRAITDVQNAQKALGDEMLPLAEKGSSMWQAIQVAALKFFTYLVKAFKQGIARFVDMYNSSMVVRAGFALITVSIKSLWNTLKLFTNFAVTSFKIVAKQVLGLGKMGEGLLSVFTGNFKEGFSKIKNGFTEFFASPWKGIKEQWKNFKDFGSEAGQNFVDGFREIANGRITAPSFKRKGGSAISASTTEEEPGGSGGGNGKPKNTPATDDRDRMKVMKAERQAELNRQKYFYEESAHIYKKHLSEKRISQEQYDAIISNLQAVQADQQVKTEKEFLEKIKQMDIKSTDLRKAAIIEQEQNILKAENESYNARTAAYERYQENLQRLTDAGMSNSERMEYDHQLQLKTLDGYYKASLQYAQEHNEELVSIDLAYQQAKEKLEKDFTLRLEQEKFSIRQQYGIVTDQELFNAEIQRLEQQYQGKMLSEQEFLDAKARLQKDYDDSHREMRIQLGIATDAEVYQAELDRLKEFLDQKKITQEEYEEAVSQMRINKAKESFDRYASLVGNAISALQDAEMANVDAKYDAEIDAARKAGKDTTELEKKKENEKLKIQKKYADINFAIKAAQIVADTSVSIMKAYAELGPIAGSIAAALMAVTGAAQLAAANAERQKIKNMTLNDTGNNTPRGERVATGRESGGYLDVEREQDGRHFHAKYDPGKRGYVNRPTVIVGEGANSREWVASNAALQNPTIAPVVDALDKAQRQRNIRTLDFNKFLIQERIRGFSGGGSISGDPIRKESSYKGTPVSGSRTLDRLADILDRIERNGIKSLIGIDEIDAQNKKREESRNIAKKS